MARETKTSSTTTKAKADPVDDSNPSAASVEPFEPPNAQTGKTADQIHKEKLDSSEAPQVDKATLEDKRRPASPFRSEVHKIVKDRDKTDKDGNVVMDDEERAAVNAIEHAVGQYEELKRVQAKRAQQQRGNKKEA
jgi:hypothetical protein